MDSIKFEIRHSNGEREFASVEGSSVLVGSAAHCDVRLPVDEASPELVLIRLDGTRLLFEAKVMEPEVILDGQPLGIGASREGSLLGIGGVRLLVRADSQLGASPTTPGRRETGNSPLSLLALAGIVLTGAVMLLRDRSTVLSPPPDQPVELFSTLVPSCPLFDAGRARAFAEQQEALAATKQERLPFAVEEGIAAVDLYQTAAACFRTAAARERAEAAEDAAHGLEQALYDDFRARRLRLSHMLIVKDYALARVDVARLSAMTRGKATPYAEWLDGVAQDLARKESR